MTTIIKTDVLVVGGGLSGCNAAISAASTGVKVTLMEKSNTERSGAAGTGNDHFWFYDPEIHSPRNWSISDMIRDISTDGEYGKTKHGLMDQELLEVVAEGTKAAVDRLESWGVQFKYDAIYPWNLQYQVQPNQKRYRIIPQFQSEWDTLHYDGRDIKKRLTEQCNLHGVQILNRISGTGLLVSHEKIIGATGINTRTGEFYVIEAKAVIIATGMDQWRLFKPTHGDWFNSQSPPYITGDGEAMALRAGAEVFILPPGKTTNNGFQYWRNICRSSPTATTCYPAGNIVDSEGQVMIKNPGVREPMRKRRHNVEKSVADGHTPFYLDLTNASEEQIKYVEWSYGNEGLCWMLLEAMREHGIDFRKDMIELELEEPGRLSGGFLAPFVNTDCSTSLEGLFCSSPVQFAGEVAAPTYTVLGWRAGEKAAKYASSVEQLTPEKEMVEKERVRAQAPLECVSGPTWQEVNRELNQIMEEFIKYVAGFNPPGSPSKISRVGILNCREQLNKLACTMMRATSPHELARCNEVMSLIEVGVAMVQAALQEEQYRDGYWFLGRRSGDEMLFRFRPINVKYPSKGAG
jgi:succinate dehydrogenase/fumarate reductase flavoprotein subunit